jgi:alkylation response protein AidB-like acyl-CoA dehydrogenase
MPLEFKCSSSGEEVESFRASWVRFVETEMLRHDAEARRRGHVGHELWRRAGELGFRGPVVIPSAPHLCARRNGCTHIRRPSS